MGQAELKAALQREAEMRAQKLWQRAETMVEARRQEVEQDAANIEAEAERLLAKSAAAARSRILSKAQQEASACRLETTEELSLRLQKQAHQMLPEIGRQGGSKLWFALHRELPKLPWETVWVCDADVALAKEAFPNAHIIVEDALAGGLAVATKEGQIKIDNSLACRLRRAWSDLLPLLVKELYRRLDDDAAACADTAK